MSSDSAVQTRAVQIQGVFAITSQQPERNTDWDDPPQAKNGEMMQLDQSKGDGEENHPVHPTS